MQASVEQSEALAIEGGAPCVVDPPSSYLHGPQEIGDEEIKAVTDVLRSQNLFRFFRDESTSPTAQFEQLFGELTGAKHALAVNSGTSALICGMIGLGVSAGDEVIVPAYTYIATAAAALACRAFPVIAEIDRSLTLDPADVERKITPRTKLIVPVHMRGTPCRMQELVDIGKRHGIPVLEDCAQANGGRYRGKPLGSIGDAGAFSFQHFKIMTAGEGGALVTNNLNTFQRAACYHDSAYAFWKGEAFSFAPFSGENYRMSELNGALALAQLRKRDRLLARLREIKRRIVQATQHLKGMQLQDVPDADGDCSVSFVFYTGSPDRAQRVSAALRAEGMQAGSMFDKGIPDRHVYYHWDYVMEKRTPDVNGLPWTDPHRPCQVTYSRDMCPRSLEILNQAVVVPLTQTMSDRHVDSCIEAIVKVHSRLLSTN